MSYVTATEAIVADKRSASWRHVKAAARNLHVLLTALFAGALIPAFSAAGLPPRINWARFLSAYWIGLAACSIFVAAFLYLLGFPLQESLIPLWRRYWGQKIRLAVLAVFATAMVWEFGPVIGLLLIVDTVAFLEFFDRIGGDPVLLGRAAQAVFIPALYFFAGLVLVFCYNDVVASLKFAGSYDTAFNRLDALLFHGWTASRLAHAAVQRLPLRVFNSLELVYYGMFVQIGVAFLITALHFGRRRALELAGTLLTAYYLALAIFFFWPSIGPFAICPTHFVDFPRSLTTYQFHAIFVAKARALWAHRGFSSVDTDFFIAFPSMHVAQPLIVLWFLRTWKRIAIVLVAYDAVLVAAILLLEWHYFVDLLGGAAVAALAILIVRFGDKASFFHRNRSLTL